MVGGLGAWLAVAFAPEPVSDWKYYWTAAGAARLYERGGAALSVVGLLKATGLPPHLAMLIPNTVAAGTVLWATRAVDPSRGKWLAHLVAAYLLLLAPYLSLVQLDLMAAAFLAGGVWAIARPAPGRYCPWLVGGAILLVAAAVSTRPQLLLVSMVLALFLTAIWLVQRRDSGPLPVLVPVLLAGALLGFVADSALRAQANRSSAVRTTSAVTLYSGLLVSSTQFPGCGHWSSSATAAMRADLGKPLHVAVLDRLQSRPLRHWGGVLGCKMSHIVLPRAFAWYWLTSAPNAMPATTQRQQRSFHRVVLVEFWLHRGLTLVLYAVALGVAIRSRLPAADRMLPLLWLASFVVVHMVFEVQSRYFLAMLLLLPLMSSLGLGAPLTARAQPLAALPLAGKG